MSGGFSHQRCLLQGRVLVWRSQPAKEWPAGWKKCLEQRTRDKNPSWALSQRHSFVASAVKLWKVWCFLRSQCPRRALPIKIQSVHPPVQGTCEINPLRLKHGRHKNGRGRRMPKTKECQLKRLQAKRHEMICTFPVSVTFWSAN